MILTLGERTLKNTPAEEGHLAVSVSLPGEPGTITPLEKEKKNTELPRLFLLVQPT